MAVTREDARAGTAGDQVMPARIEPPRFTLWMVWAAGACLIAISVVIVFEAVVRKAFGMTLGGVNEITGYVFAITTAWAFPHALARKANVRITAFSGWLTLGPRLLLEGTALVATAVFFGYLALRGGELALDSLLQDRRSNSSLQTPMVVPQALWVLGLVVQLAILGWMAWRFVAALATRRWALGLEVLSEEEPGAIARRRAGAVTGAAAIIRQGRGG